MRRCFCTSNSSYWFANTVRTAVVGSTCSSNHPKMQEPCEIWSWHNRDVTTEDNFPPKSPDDSTFNFFTNSQSRRVVASSPLPSIRVDLTWRAIVSALSPILAWEYHHCPAICQLSQDRRALTLEGIQARGTCCKLSWQLSVHQRALASRSQWRKAFRCNRIHQNAP